jgi:hypothetical protein
LRNDRAAMIKGKRVLVVEDDEMADALVRRNVPFAFVTGYDRVGLPQPFQNIAMW